MVILPLPPELRGRIFDRSEALAAGISPRMLEGPRLVRIHTGVYRYADTEMTYALQVAAARRIGPRDAALSHVSNLRWRGLAVGPETPVHLSSNSRTHVERPDVRVHRRQGSLHPRLLRGVPVLGPDRTFVDCGTQLGVRALVAVGDWLIAQGHTDLQTLRAYVIASHLDGVIRARDAAAMVREGSESFRESELRWHLVRAGLPEPVLNVNIFDQGGRFLARGDLVFREWKVLVEYDGWHHERDAVQRQRDHLRREALEAAGWRVIVVTTADMRRTNEIVWRVFGALEQRGYRGQRPRVGR
jgi:very-short-patch-repair endonuclease